MRTTGVVLVVAITVGCGTGGAPATGDNGAAEVAVPAKAAAPVEVATPNSEQPETVKPESTMFGDDVDSGPRVESDEPLAEIPSMPISQLLGKKRADIETLFHPSEPGHAEGWVKYNEHLEVRYEKSRCVELIQLVRGGLTCRAAARWVGFGEPMAPIYRSKSCVWPADSIKHKLGRGVSGELTLEGGIFRAKLDR